MSQRELKEFEARGWNERADTYAQLTGRVTTQVAPALLDAAAVAAGHRVLDLACGTGQVTGVAARRGALPAGVDLSEEMVDAARATHRGVEFRVGDAESLPFPDHQFDAAAGGFVLNHLPHPERAAAECARVVASGGRVAFAVWDRPRRSRLIALIGEALERAGGDRSAGVPDGPDDFRFADDGQMRRLLEGAGLTGVQIDVVEVHAEVANADELWDGLLGGLVRAPSALASHDETTRERVRAEFDQLAEEFTAGGGGLRVPAVVRIGSAQVP